LGHLAATPALHHVLDLHVDVDTPIDIGPIGRGRRRTVQIVGGTFEGSGAAGTILSGVDHQIVRDDDVVEIEARYTLRASSGALIGVQSAGMRHAPADVMKQLMAGEAVDPAQVYFRTAITFETSAPDLAWLMRSIFLGVGERRPNAVIMRVWRVD
jgi:hypothetical protein